MKPDTFWLGRAAVVLGALALLTLGVTLLGSQQAPLRLALARHADRLDQRLRAVRSGGTGRGVLAGQLVLVVVLVGAATFFDAWLLCLLVPLVVFAPGLALDVRVAKRTAQVESQLEAWLGAVANALKSSASLGEAIASSARLVPAPMSEEIDLVMKEYELGTPLDDALERFSERVTSQSVAGAVLALKVARRSGGNLPEMLENASAALRELARLEGVVRAKTAEGKAQAFVLGVIPIPLVLGVRWSDPHYFEPMAGSFVGHLVIGGATVLWLSAVLLARKILAVDV